MNNICRTFIPVAAIVISVSASGCCVTSISCRKAACPCPAQSYQSNYAPAYAPGNNPAYQAIPQGISPVDTPPIEQPSPPQPYIPPAPAPAPAPTPTTSSQSLGTKTSMLFHSMSERIKDVFER